MADTKVYAVKGLDPETQAYALAVPEALAGVLSFRDDQCWPWLGVKTRKGYGTISVRLEGKKRILYTHRVLYKAFHSDFDIFSRTSVVMHTCDTPWCNNYVSHLVGGTQADNIRDMYAKRRHPLQYDPSVPARGERHGSKTHPESVLRGERNPFAKLIQQQVNEIRQRYVPLVVTHKMLAAEYGVSRATIASVVQNARWKDM